MKKHCPEWLFSSVAALSALRYLSSPFGLDVVASKYARILSERYAEVTPNMLEQAGAEFLRILAEAEADNADQVLNSYAYNRLTFENNGEQRKIRGIFSSALDGTKTPEFTVDSVVKGFRPFFYMTRTKPGMIAPASWTWAQVRDGDWIGELPEVEISILDSFGGEG